MYTQRLRRSRLASLRRISDQHLEDIKKMILQKKEYLEDVKKIDEDFQVKMMKAMYLISDIYAEMITKTVAVGEKASKNSLNTDNSLFFQENYKKMSDTINSIKGSDSAYSTIDMQNLIMRTITEAISKNKKFKEFVQEEFKKF